MIIRNYKYTPEDVDCRYCTEFIHNRCRAAKCPWLNERIEAGVVSYQEAVRESFEEHSPLYARVRIILGFYDKSFWKDDAHFNRFQMAQAILGYYRKRNTNAYYSALFLLTSDEELFKRVLDCFSKRGMDNIDYDALIESYPYDRERLEEMLEIIVETICTTKEYVRIGGSEYAAEVVRSRLMKLNMHHIEFVISCMKENTTKIRNIKQYLLTTLYNATLTMDNYYSALVQHDLYGGSR